MAILSGADLDLVRQALGPQVTSAQLADAVVAADLYLGVAEDAVLARVPDAADVVDAGAAPGATEAEQLAARRVKRAIAYLTAAEILARSPEVTGAQFADMSFQTVAERDARVAALREEAAGVLDDLEASTDAGVPVLVFRIPARRRVWGTAEVNW